MAATWMNTWGPDAPDDEVAGMEDEWARPDELPGANDEDRPPEEEPPPDDDDDDEDDEDDEEPWASPHVPLLQVPWVQSESLSQPLAVGRTLSGLHATANARVIRETASKTRIFLSRLPLLTTLTYATRPVVGGDQGSPKGYHALGLPAA